MPRRRLDVPDRHHGVGNGREKSRIVDEQLLERSAVEVAVGLDEAHPVGQEVRRLVVVDGVAAERVPPLHEHHVEDPYGQSGEHDEGQAPPERGRQA